MDVLSGNNGMVSARKCQGKVLVVASVASMISQFNIPNIKLLLSMGYCVDVACNFMEGSTCTRKEIQELMELLVNLHVGCYQVSFRRNALDLKAAYIAYRELCNVIQGRAQALGGTGSHRYREPYVFIHAHSPIGGAVGRIAARRNGVRSIYTAHGFHFYHGAPLQNWLLFYTAEKLLSYITDILVTINKEDYRRAKGEFHAGKVAYISGIGVDTGRFGILRTAVSVKRAVLGLKEDDIVLLSEVGTGSTGICSVLGAISLLKKEPFYPHIQYIVYGQGITEKEACGLAKQMGICGHVRFVREGEDISDIYGCADIFLCLTGYMAMTEALAEAMAAGLPAISPAIHADVGQENIAGVHAGDRPGVITCSQHMQGLAAAIRLLAQDSVLRGQIGADAQNFIRSIGLAGGSIPFSGKKPFSRYRRAVALADRLEIRRKHRIPPDAFVILSVGELNANKNHRVIIEAMAELGDKDIYYIICGRGKKLEEYKSLRQELGLRNRVILAGFQGNVEKYYHSADVFVFPSKREGLGMAALEAMAAGLPLISSDAGGILDYSQDGVTGHVVAGGMAKDYAKAIQEVKESGAWNFYSRNAMARALRFGQESVNGKMMRIYKECGKYITSRDSNK